MHTRHLALAIGAALLTGAPAAQAQDSPRPYDQGAVWEISEVHTKPGHFDDYMKFVAGPWRHTQEALKKVGVVLDYKVLNTFGGHDGDADLILLVEWKNMGVFDASLAEQDSITQQVYGSVGAANQADMDRESIRHIGSDTFTRELVLTPGR